MNCTIAVAMLLTLAGSAAAQVLPACGGLGERSCRPWDKEFWTMDSLACEYDLVLKGTRCKERNRTTQPDSAGWIGWALREQRHNIQGTLPVNWATHFGTHNSYSSTRQGFVHVMAANQYYSITDQLQLGARFVRLDPHWYYDNLRLCHGENKHQCATTAPGRLFAMGVKEIADWLKYHDEVLFIRVHDRQLGEGDDPTKHPKHVLKPFEEYLGAAKILRPGDWDVSAKGWPTMNDLKAMGKRVVIFSTHHYTVDSNGNYYGDEPSKGERWFFKYGDYFGGSYKVDEFDRTACTANGWNIRQRSRNSWWFLGEGLTGSDAASTNTGILNETQVRNAIGCDVSYIGVDWFMAQDKALFAAYKFSGPDLRREASIWSWKEGEYGNKGPALLKSVNDGRWVSESPLIPNQVACGKRDTSPTSLTTTPWRVTAWRITSKAGNWYMGAGLCSELNTGTETGWTFAAPRTAYENRLLRDQMTKQNVNTVWLNYAAKPVPEPVASPAYFSFDMQRGGAIPADERIMLYSSPDVQYNVTNVETRPWLSVAARSGVAQPSGVPSLVGIDRARLATFAAGSYTDSLAFTRTNEPPALEGQPTVKRRPGYVSAHLHIYEPTTSKLELLNGTAAVPSGTPTRVRVTVTSTNPTVNDYTTGIARLVRVIEVVQDGATRKDIEILAEKPLEPNNHLVSSVAFDVQLPPGTHTLIGGYRGDDKHAPSETSPIAVKVAAALRISPAEAVTMNYVIGEPAPPSVRFEALDQTTNRPVASNWAVKSLAPATGVWTAMSPAVNSSMSLMSVIPAALDKLGPGYYESRVDVTRPDAGTTTTRDVTTRVMAPNFDALPAAVNVTTGVFHRQTIWMSGKYRFEASVKAATENGKPWLKFTRSPGAMFVDITMDPTGLTPGVYKGTLEFFSVFVKAQTVRVPVTMTVAAPVRFTVNGNFNHAGVLILVNGQRKALPFFVDSYAGATFEIQPLYESNTFIRFGFSSWSDGGASKHTVTVGTAPIALTLNSYRDYLVRTVIVGSGTIKRTPAAPDSMYRENTVVTFEAVPAPGFKFVGWSNGLSGTNRVQTLKVTLNHTVQANFARL
jgi:hypothetical protein